MLTPPPKIPIRLHDNMSYRAINKDKKDVTCHVIFLQTRAEGRLRPSWWQKGKLLNSSLSKGSLNHAALALLSRKYLNHLHPTYFLANDLPKPKPQKTNRTKNRKNKKNQKQKEQKKQKNKKNQKKNKKTKRTKNPKNKKKKNSKNKKNKKQTNNNHKETSGVLASPPSPP